SRSSTAAPKGAVAATPIRATSAARDERRTRTQPRERLPARLLRRAIEDQHAVEVVELVRDDAGVEPLELVHDLRAPHVPGLYGDRGGTLDRHLHTPERQAALVVDDPLAAADRDERIDERVQLLVLAETAHEQPPDDADLRRGQADAARVDHQPGHPLGELPQTVVEVFHLARDEPEGRIRIL